MKVALEVVHTSRTTRSFDGGDGNFSVLPFWLFRKPLSHSREIRIERFKVFTESIGVLHLVATRDAAEPCSRDIKASDT